jgi:hypothetical protein
MSDPTAVEKIRSTIAVARAEAVARAIPDVEGFVQEALAGLLAPPAPPPEPLPTSLAGLCATELAALQQKAPEHFKRLMDEKTRRAAGGRVPSGPEIRDTVVVPPGENTPWGRTLPRMAPQEPK